MTTIQIKKRSKAAKVLLDLARIFSKEEQGIEIIETPKKKGAKKDYPISKNVPNEETLRVFKESDEGKNLSKPQNLEEFLKEMDSW